MTPGGLTDVYINASDATGMVPITGTETVVFDVEGAYYQVVVSANTGGSISLKGTYMWKSDTSLSVKVTPNKDYKIQKVTVNGTSQKNMENSRVAKTLSIGAVESNLNISVLFESVPTYIVTVVVHGKGTVSGEGVYNEGDTVHLSVNAAKGYKFSKWGDATTMADKSFTIDHDTILDVYFVADDSGELRGSPIDNTTAIIIIVVFLIVMGLVVLIVLLRGRNR